MPFKFLTPLNCSNCPHCYKSVNAVLCALGVTMDNAGNLRNPNENYQAYLMQIGVCVACRKNSVYDFDIELHCGGKFNVYRANSIYWVFDKWTCQPPSPTGKIAPMSEDKTISDENVNLVAPVQPGWMLQQWFEKQSPSEQRKFKEKTHLSDAVLSTIFNGSKPIDRDVALQLSEEFGTAAQFWMWMQMNYDEYEKTGHEIDKSNLPFLFN